MIDPPGSLIDQATSAEVKSCCAALYENDWAKLLLGASFHPGGLRSTDRLARLLGIDATDYVLDVACGQGASALYLAKTFGCRAIGVDLSVQNVAVATAAAQAAGLEHLATFHAGDGEAIPLADAAVDVVICECAFCTFPSKERAVAEFARVLRPSGRVGLSDLTRAGQLPPELQDLLAWVACIADARPVDEYMAYLQGVGLVESIVEPRDEALAEMVNAIQQQLLGIDLVMKLATDSVPGLDLSRAKAMARAAARAVRAGQLGYALMVAHKPASSKTV